MDTSEYPDLPTLRAESWISVQLHAKCDHYEWGLSGYGVEYW